MKCVCRNCDKIYDELKSRAGLQGYCSSLCQHNKAKKLGFRAHAKVPPVSEYQILKQAGEIGSVPFELT